MYRGSPLRSTLNTSYITGLGMCKVCTEAVHCGALWTRVTLQVWACVKHVPRQSIASYITGLGMCKVCTEAVHCGALWTRVTLQVWACVKYAVHCGALWTRVTLQVWACVKYVPRQSIASYITGLGMCKVCTEAVHCRALWTRVTLQVWACVKYVPRQGFHRHMAKSRKRGPRVSKWTKSSSSYGDYHRMYARLHAIGAQN